MTEKKSINQAVKLIAWVLMHALVVTQACPASVWSAPAHSADGQTLRVQQPESDVSRAQIAGRLAASAGLEELTPAKLIDGWSGFSQPDRKRLGDQLRRLADKPTLARLVEYAQNSINPPYTLYELLAKVLGQPIPVVQAMVEGLNPSAYRPPQTISIGESHPILWNADEVRQHLENTVIVIAAGGGGARFKRSLWTKLREQLERNHRLEKPTVMVGPSGTSPVVHTLEEISELARLVGAKNVRVVVVASPDSMEAVQGDIKKNSRFVDPKRVKVRVTEQKTHPSFHTTSGKILTTTDEQGRPVLLRNPNGTYGAFSAGYELAKKEGFAAGKSWLVLYGDDPVLNSGDFIARVLTIGKDLDVAPIVTRKISRTNPVGGTLVDVELSPGLVLPLIIEKAEREPNAAAGIPGLPAFNQVEDAAAQTGNDPFGFNTGVMKLSARAAEVAGGLILPIRHADRERDDLPGNMRRNMELFATHIPTYVIGTHPEMTYRPLQVELEQYGATKDYGKVVEANLSRDARSRQRLNQLLQAAPAVQVQIGENVYLDIRPSFQGFKGKGTLELKGPMGVVLSRDGLTAVRIIERHAEGNNHPLYADPGQGQQIIAATNGIIDLTGDQVVDGSQIFAGQEEPVQILKSYFPDQLQGPGEKPFWMQGLTPVDTLAQIIPAAQLDSNSEIWILGGGDGRVGIAAAVLAKVKKAVFVEVDDGALAAIHAAADHFVGLGLVNRSQIGIMQANIFSPDFQVGPDATHIYHTVGGAYNPEGHGAEQVIPKNVFPQVIEKIKQAPVGTRVIFYLGAEGEVPHYYEQAVISSGLNPWFVSGLDQNIVQIYRVPSAGLEQMPPSPITGWIAADLGNGWRRLLYQLQNGDAWFGGLVRNDVPDSQIDDTAYISPSSTVEGKASRLEAGAVVKDGSAVVDSVIQRNAHLIASIAESARIRPMAALKGAVVRPAYEEDDWSYSGATSSDPRLSVKHHEVTYEGYIYRVEVEAAALVESSDVQGSFIGKKSVVQGSAIVISQLGDETDSHRVKWSLVTAPAGHLQVQGIQRLPGREIPAATEISETAILGVSDIDYRGTQFSIRNTGYTEMVALNRIPLASYFGKNLSFAWYPKQVPPLMLLGDGAIFSIFAGAPNPQSIKTDGTPTPGVITRISGAPGEQTSQHGRIVADPMTVVAGFTKVIGRLLGFPDLADPQAVSTEAEVTHLGALSVSGFDESLTGPAGPEIWGQMIPGEARGQLSRKAGLAPWVFLYSPETIFTLMGRLAEGLPEDQKDRYDDLPRRLLESGLALSQWMLDQEQAKGAQGNTAVMGRFWRYVEGYEALLNSGAWEGPWAQMENGMRRPAHWRQVGEFWESQHLPLSAIEEIHRKVHPVQGAPYRQVTVDQLMRIPGGIDRPAWDQWSDFYPSASDFEIPAFPPLDKMEVAPADLAPWRIIGQDERYYYTQEGGRIDREIDLEDIHPSAFIGPGTVLVGKKTVVAEGARLVRVIAKDSMILTNTRLQFVKMSHAIISQDVRLTFAKLTGSQRSPVSIGPGTTGSFIGIAESRIDANNTLHPFALIISSSTAPGNIIGGWLIQSVTQPGYMNMHLSTAAMGLSQNPVTFRVDKKEYNVGAAALNVAGGLFIGSSQGKEVEISSAYPLSNATIGAGAWIGAFSVIKDEVEPGAALLPFTFSAYSNAAGHPSYGQPGRHNDRIGGSLDLPGIFMRNFIYRTKKGIWDSMRAQGWSDEDIRKHPRLSHSDYMVEALIVETLREIFGWLEYADPIAHRHLEPPVQQLLIEVGLDLEQIQQADQASLGPRTHLVRQRIQALIADIGQRLGSIPGSRPEGPQAPAGHTVEQLLDGIRRLSENLDGRWRMRDQTFTEVRWEYVGFDSHGVARNTWVPVSLHPAAATPSAGLEEGTLTLEQWQGILKNPIPSGFWGVLRKRYGSDKEILNDRLNAYRGLVKGALANGFDPKTRVVVTVAAPGRDRVFMGHTDFPGLGGPTIDAGTREEILAVLQKTDDRTVYFSNADSKFQPVSFVLTGPDPVHQEMLMEHHTEAAAKAYQMSAIQEVAHNLKHLMETGGWPDWSVDKWDSYLRGALAFLMGDFPGVEAKLTGPGFRFHAASAGKLALSAGMGSSSSSALNLALVKGLNRLFDLGLTDEQLGRIDFSEQLLGKKKGAGDSMAIVYARKDKVVVTGSYPERLIQMVDFPAGLAVLMAQSPIPRLTTSEGEAWLKKQYPDAKVADVQTWARETLYRYSGRAYELAVALLLETLNEPHLYAGQITGKEATAIKKALLHGNKEGLLRELNAGGAIEQYLPELAGWENRHKRYNLIYRLLRLLPETASHGQGISFGLRKSTLYGLAEVERGVVYVRELEAAVAAERRKDFAAAKQHIRRVLELVRRAHDGDRAAEDYRQDKLELPAGHPKSQGVVFPETGWAGSPGNDVSNAAIDAWIAKQAELADLPGGFERSIPDFDEIADQAEQLFKGKVAVRVAAAGLGGSMALHIDATDGPEIVEQVNAWLTGLGWKVRRVEPSASVEIIAPPVQAGKEEGMILQTLFDQMPAAAADQAVADWLDSVRRASQPGLAAPAVSTARYIFGQYEQTSSLNYRQKEELWNEAAQRIGDHLENPFETAWALEVFGHLDGMITTPPAKDPLRKILTTLGWMAGQPSAGLEEIPPAANPLSPSYAPWQYEAASPTGYSSKPVAVIGNPGLASELRHLGYRVVETEMAEAATLPLEITDVGQAVVALQKAGVELSPVFDIRNFNPKDIAEAVKAGKQVRIRTQRNRVGENLWAKQANRPELQALYRLVYDIADGAETLSSAEISRVIEGLNHPNQAVAAAARDVVVHTRLYHLTETLKKLVKAYQEQEGSALGPYAAHYMRDALTTRIDPVGRNEWGSPETPVFAGPMTADRRATLQKQLVTFVTPGNKLAMLTGSGQRMGATIGEVEAGLTLTDKGGPTGFLSDQILVDPGSQPHDVVNVLFALVAKLFVENMPKWREDPELGGKPGDMPAQWGIGLGMDPRRSGAAIFQVAARIFRKKGVNVVFTGINSAPEAAARALLSDSTENVLGFFEITPSHIPEGNQGTKLMLWLGQILPWAKAEEFNEQIRAAAADPKQVNEVIDMLMDPAMNAEVEKLIEGLEQGYQGSRQRYHRYLKQLFTGNFQEGFGADQSLEHSWQQLKADLARTGVVPVIDINGGARAPDQPLFRELTPGFIVVGERSADFAHSLPPGEVSSRLLQEFAKKMTPAFEAAGLTPIFVGPDPDGDRKSIILRNPNTGAFEYLDPQAGYMLDVLYHVISAQEVGIPGIGVVGNGPTTVVAEALASRLGYEFRTAETGEANVVKAINNLIVELEGIHGRGRTAVMGGEGSAAATILGKVQVRDMAQAFGSAFGFIRNPERVKLLIDKLIDDPQEKQALRKQVDQDWYRPEQIQFLLWRIVNEILPPMLNSDPAYKTEVHLGVGLGAGSKQKFYKDTADKLLSPGSEWVRRIQMETAARISAVTGEVVSADQITVSEPINNIEAYQVFGAGNRMVPDGSGRIIHDGGYEIHVSYTPSADAKFGVPGRPYYLYKLWLRGSKTEVGVTRRLFLGTAEFLPREKAREFLQGLLDGIYPIWLTFMNALEAEELRGHVDGVFPVDELRAAFHAEIERGDLDGSEIAIRRAVLTRLESGADALLDGTPAVRAVNIGTFATPGKPDYNPVDTRNLRWQDKRVEGAMEALNRFVSFARPVVDELRDIAQEVQQKSRVMATQAKRINELIHQLQGWLADQAEAPLAAGSSPEEVNFVLAQRLVFQSLVWKVDHLLQGVDFSDGQRVRRKADVNLFARRVDWLFKVFGDLEALAGRGTAQQHPDTGVAHANLVAAKIILSRELEILQEAASAGLEGDWVQAVLQYVTEYETFAAARLERLRDAKLPLALGSIRALLAGANPNPVAIRAELERIQNRIDSSTVLDPFSSVSLNQILLNALGAIPTASAGLEELTRGTISEIAQWLPAQQADFQARGIGYIQLVYPQGSPIYNRGFSLASRTLQEAADEILNSAGTIVARLGLLGMQFKAVVDQQTLIIQPASAGLEETPVNVGLSIGGTKIAAGVLSPQGLIGNPDDQPAPVTWANLKAVYPQIKNARGRGLQAMVDQVQGALQKYGIAPERLAEVAVSWAGDGEYEQGRVRNTKLIGFRDKRYVNLKKLLEAELQKVFGRPIPVKIMHDGAAGAVGTFQHPQGALHGLQHGVGITLGTGFSVGVVQDGKPVYSIPGRIPIFLGEMGWHTVQKLDGTYLYKGSEVTLDNRLPAPLPDEIRVEQRLGGPWIAARYVRAIRNAGLTDVEVFGQEIQLGLDIYPVNQQEIVPAESQQRVVLRTVTQRALAGDVLSRDFIRQIGTEVGSVYRVYRQAYADLPFISQGKTALLGGVGEKFGLGVANEAGADLFLSAIRAAAGTDDIVRSELGYQGEFAFATPKTDSAGLEGPVELPAGALTDKIIFLGPEVAVPELFSGLAGLRPAPGERLELVVFARDAFQKSQVEQALDSAGLELLEPVIDVAAQYDGDLYSAVADRQMTYFSRNVDVHVLFTFAGLRELGRFLQIPDLSIRTWIERIERAVYGIQA